jgi:hypothetical protein
LSQVCFYSNRIQSDIENSAKASERMNALKTKRIGLVKGEVWSLQTETLVPHSQSRERESETEERKKGKARDRAEREREMTRDRDRLRQLSREDRWRALETANLKKSVQESDPRSVTQIQREGGDAQEQAHAPGRGLSANSKAPNASTIDNKPRMQRSTAPTAPIQAAVAKPVTVVKSVTEAKEKAEAEAEAKATGRGLRGTHTVASSGRTTHIQHERGAREQGAGARVARSGSALSAVEVQNFGHFKPIGQRK